MLWIFLIPAKQHAIDAQNQNEKNIAKVHRIVEIYEREFKTLPDSMTELKAYARAKKFKADFYDAYGNSLEYIPLSPKDYIVRSFGKEGSQNTPLQERNDASSTLKSTPKETPEFEYWQGPRLAPYPSVLVAGSNSPNGEWFAQIFANFKDGKKRLTVHNKRKRSFYMVAQHDSVEEFLWLPSGYALIFSATSSTNYRDGVYYWDLLEDELVNLLTVGSFDAHLPVPTNSANEFMISLAGLEIDASKVYFYLAHKNHGDQLDPLEFYSSEALVAATIPINIEAPVRLTQALPDQELNLFEQDAIDFSLKASSSLTLRLQHEWMHLSLSGDVYDNIEKWQNFASRASHSALFPYILFNIINLYHSAYSENISQSENELAQLRSLGGEMARALAEYPLAPTYLKAMARFSYNQIMQGHPILYRADALKPTLR